ncbi:folliculin-interacting protein N-terminus-domain-containing protein [Bisporella sp. PMI_857]|nr:folliculin-interacting protein N-terminus-domain-containing protein [Bisporella sp. PMI_857]
MSLLGKLFSSSSSTAQTGKSLESNLEDTFTYNLLFPDSEALCHNDQVFKLSSATVLPTTINAFDISGDIDLETRDVRVIIMQETTPVSGSAYLLFDSHPPPPPSPSLDRQAAANASGYPTRSEGRRSISSPRKTSVGQNSRPLVIQQDTPRAFGAFDRRPQHGRQLSYNETEAQRIAREYREEVTAFSSCIFGTSEVLAYKGAGTKVHILPSEPKPPTTTSSSYMGDGSLGRSSMRSSRLAQSFTSENLGHGPTSAGLINTNIAPRSTDRKKVLITRMFPVPLSNNEMEDGRTPTPLEHSVGYPFPKVGGGEFEEKESQPKQKRTPMYAVGLVINLPAAPHPPSAPVSRSSFRGSGSYNEQDSYPSSFNSARRSGWTMLGHGFGVESMDSSFCSDVDDRIDSITQHWDIIMRTLSHLQSVATASLLPMLKQADITSPEPRFHMRTPSASISIAGKRVDDSKLFKLPKSNAKLVHLTANCLMPVQKIHKEVDASRQRIVSGLKTSQVVTGQGRWGIWREEARTVGKWAGSKDEGFFFFNLLTGFLGNHTEWLQALGPSDYRRRHYQRHRANRDDEISIPARTIIVSDNKLMARRLIFLLSAFLPTNQPVEPGRLHRPSTSTSFRGYSQSPPTHGVPILREESLRRRINKRAGVGRAAHTRTMSFPAHAGHAPEIHHHDRRVSDAASIKTANLPIPGSDIGTRKSSTATASTITPVTTMPHFSRRPTQGTGPAPRPESSGSLATDDLLRSLKRGDSSGQYSTTSSDSQGQNSRWGSMISGFWSSKRRDSTANSSPPKVEGIVINDPHYKASEPRKIGKLAEMVEEVSSETPNIPQPQQERQRKSESGSAETAKPESDAGGEIAEQTVHVKERIPDPSGAYESPVKTSISPSDGVIDIDVPLPEYLSFETAVSSPSSSGYSFSAPGFGNGLDGFEHYSRTGPDSETTMNIGGWLPRYHPDFVLQAIPAGTSDDLLEEVRESLRAEPTPISATTPNPVRGQDSRWVDISSAIVADTTNFTIKHIRYRRLVKPTATTPALPSSLDSRYGNVYLGAPITPNINAYDTPIEERFIEEPIISMDDILIEAVERIIAQSGQGSKTTSVSSSRSASRKGEPTQERSNSTTREARPHLPAAHLEVPRNECKKMVLTALEQIVQSVVESREKEAGPTTPHERYEGKLGATERERESFLREGVRAWLGSVETDD